MGGVSSPAHGGLEEEQWKEPSEEEDDEEGERWLKHYSSGQEILLVGEGDFSFSCSLATAFRQASNITATSLDPYDVVVAKYAKAKANLETLEKMGATLLHGVDATMMKCHTDLKMRKFDRIIFNFPHAGFKGMEDQLRSINSHRKLVQGFFRNASRMLRPNGGVHVSHKIGFPFHKWNLEELASKNSLILKECVDFKIEDYPGYNNKRGDGARCDEPFHLGLCYTYIFIIGDVPRKKKASGRKMALVSGVSLCERSEANDDSRILTRNVLPLVGSYPLTENMSGMASMQRRVYSPLRIGISSEIMGAFGSGNFHGGVYSPPPIPISNFANGHSIFSRHGSESIHLNETPGGLSEGYFARQVREFQHCRNVGLEWLAGRRPLEADAARQREMVRMFGH